MRPDLEKIIPHLGYKAVNPEFFKTVDDLDEFLSSEFDLWSFTVDDVLSGAITIDKNRKYIYCIDEYGGKRVFETNEWF